MTRESFELIVSLLQREIDDAYHAMDERRHKVAVITRNLMKQKYDYLLDDN